MNAGEQGRAPIGANENENATLSNTNTPTHRHDHRTSPPPQPPSTSSAAVSQYPNLRHQDGQLRRRSTLTSIEQLTAAQNRRRFSHQSGPGRGAGIQGSISGRSPMRSPPGPQAPPKPKFRPFTRSSLDEIKQRIRDEDDARRTASNSLPDDERQYHPSTLLDTGEPDPMLEAGLPLPRALQREFPDDLIATPIEDIDKYYQNKMVSFPLPSNYNPNHSAF